MDFLGVFGRYLKKRHIQYGFFITISEMAYKTEFIE